MNGKCSGLDELWSRFPKERFEKQHRRGKLHVVERLAYFFDEDSFEEIGFGDDSDDVGVVTGRGLVNGRPVYVYAQDFTYKGGSVDLRHAKKIVNIMEAAIEDHTIVVGMIDSGGARIEGGADSLEGYALIFRKVVEASGVIPQISIIMGPSAGGAVYSPGLTDFICMVKDISYMFVNGPRVVERVTGHPVSPNELGGWHIHSSVSGVAHFVGDDEYTAMDIVKKLISYLPQHCDTWPPYEKYGGEKSFLEKMDYYSDLVSHGEVFDVHDIIEEILDENSFLEIHRDFAKNIVVGFGRLNGRVVGVVANNRMYNEGRLDSDAGVKAARFVSFCDAFNIPLLTIVDTPGFLLGVEEEHKGMIRHIAKLLYAYASSRVPSISLVIGNAYGGGYIAMGSKFLGRGVVLSWPTASIGVMKAEEAYEVFYGKHREEYSDEHRREFIRNYRERIEDPNVACMRGYVDKVVRPEESRIQIISALEALAKDYSCRYRGYGITPT